MKILVIGASGLIGGYIFKGFSALGLLKGTAYPEALEHYFSLDIRDAQAVSNIIAEFKPDTILCSAAISHVDYCEENPQEVRKVNVEGTRNVIREARKQGARFVFFSSEYVFDGRNGPYTETDKPSPLNEYGKQKVEVEEIIEKELSEFLIIRTTVVYGWEREGKNFIMQMLRNLNKGVPMRVPLDQFSSPTYAQNLADAVRDLVCANEVGIFNIVGSEVINRYEFAKIVCDVFSLDANLLIPVRTSELNQKAKRPLRAGLKIDKVNRLIRTPLLPPYQGLQKMKDEREC
jgi:dTDP-4-dehydrorhamnose reductase